MEFFKKSIAISFSLLLSVSGFAKEINVKTSELISHRTIGQWQFFVEGGLFNQDSDIYSYASTIDPVTNVENGLVSVNANQKFAGGASISYMFFDGRDFKLSFFINKGNVFNSYSPGSGLVGVTKLPAPYAVNTADSANSNIYYKNNEFSVTAGASFKPLQHVKYHPYGGFIIANVESNQITNYINTDAGGDAQVVENSSVTGAGIVIGADSSIELANKFYLNMDANIGLLAGDIKSGYRAISNIGIYNLNPKTKLSVFQKITTKLALARNFKIKENQLMIAFGYNLTGYFNTTLTHIFSDDAAAYSYHRSFANSAFSGPFASINLKLA